VKDMLQSWFCPSRWISTDRGLTLVGELSPLLLCPSAPLQSQVARRGLESRRGRF